MHQPRLERKDVSAQAPKAHEDIIIQTQQADKHTKRVTMQARQRRGLAESKQSLKI